MCLIYESQILNYQNIGIWGCCSGYINLCSLIMAKLNFEPHAHYMLGVKIKSKLN